MVYPLEFFVFLMWNPKEMQIQHDKNGDDELFGK